MFQVLSLLILFSPFVVLVITLLLEGQLDLFVNYPSLIFVIAGTLTAGAASLPVDVVARTLKPIFLAFSYKHVNLQEFVEFFNRLSVSFRRDGLFGLEREIEGKKVPYEGIKRAVQLAMEISDTKTIKEVLELERRSYLEDIENSIVLVENLGTLAPAFGLLGTVIGLIYMLANLKDPSTIGTGLALALLTTFYGLVLSNMFFTPLASRLRYLKSREEVLLTLVEKAIIFMLEGVSPKVIRESLLESLSKGKVDVFEKKVAQKEQK
ncbi:MAG: MotA/TolQ/ExbB proton channel family protein [Desulfurobacteriaceae bacterium]